MLRRMQFLGRQTTLSNTRLGQAASWGKVLLPHPVRAEDHMPAAAMDRNQGIGWQPCYLLQPFSILRHAQDQFPLSVKRNNLRFVMRMEPIRNRKGWKIWKSMEKVPENLLKILELCLILPLRATASWPWFGASSSRRQVFSHCQPFTLPSQSITTYQSSGLKFLYGPPRHSNVWLVEPCIEVNKPLHARVLNARMTDRRNVTRICSV